MRRGTPATFITGAAGRIGSATAFGSAAQGFAVALVDLKGKENFNTYNK